MKKIIKILSLFSGCGGLDLGFEMADHPDYQFKVLWANDNFKSACRTFSENFKVPLYEEKEGELEKSFNNLPSMFCGNVRYIDFTKIKAKQNFDIILGGFPCQDFSILRGKGKRKGIKVKRGRLYLHFARALIELQPKLFVAENVKGLTTANKGSAFKKIKEDFSNLDIYWKEIEDECEIQTKKTDGVKGYNLLFSDVIDFSNLGVPQKRKRLIIIGLRNDIAEKLSIEKIKMKLKKRFLNKNIFYKFPLTPIEIFKGDVLKNLQDDYKQVIIPYETFVKNMDSPRQKKFKKNIWPKYSFDIETDYMWNNFIKNKDGFEEAMVKHKKILEILNFWNRPLNEISFDDKSNTKLRELDRIKRRMNHIPPGENYKFVKGTQYQVNGLMSNIYKRIHPLKPSPTVIASGGGGTWGYHYEINRQRLTNRERARIQTFPDGFKFFGAPSHVRKQIGNAVPPMASKIIAESILNIIFDNQLLESSVKF